MRFKTMHQAALVLILFAVFVRVTAQESASGNEVPTGTNALLYSVAYPLVEGTGVTSFYDDQTIHTQILQEAVYNSMLHYYLEPIWSPDGMFLYTLRPSLSAPNNAMTWLHVYDVMSGTFTPIVDFPVLEIASYPSGIEIVRFSLSPDGRYIWAAMPEVDGISYVLDLQNGSPVAALDCPSWIGFWLSDQAFVFPYYCDYLGPQFIDLATGSTQIEIADIAIPAGSILHNLVTLDNNQVWLWATNDQTHQSYAINPLTGEEITYPSDDLWIAPDGSFAALNSQNRLLRFAGNPHEFVDTGSVGSIIYQSRVLVHAAIDYQFQPADNLHFWHYVPLETDYYAFTHTLLTTRSRTDTLVYQVQVSVTGRWDDAITPSPYGPYFLVNNEEATQLYAPTGLLWSSADRFTEFRSSDIQWSQNGEWLFFTAYDGDTIQKAVGIHLQSGVVVDAPVEEKHSIMGASPDGEWWLLMDREAEDRHIVAFHYPTGTITDLMSDFPPGERPQYSSGGNDGIIPSVFLWSPLIDR